MPRMYSNRDATRLSVVKSSEARLTNSDSWPNREQLLANVSLPCIQG